MSRITHDHPTRAGKARVALVTCSELRELDDDDRLVIGPLAARGVMAEPAVWDDPAVDWGGYDLTVLRSPWDYSSRRDEFVTWARSVPRLLNSAEIVEWNTDKSYLADLAESGVPVTPTTFVPSTADWTVPDSLGQYVIKPAVSAGSRDTGRYGPADAALAEEHMRRLRQQGRLAMVQPYLDAVDSHGETALLFFADPVGGALHYSHAIRKGAMLTGPDHGTQVLYRPESICARTPSVAERAVAAKVVATLPPGLLYARVDLIPGPDGEPVLIELELTEPSVFLQHSPGASERFADAVAGALARL